jgi:hypothetical protein
MKIIARCEYARMRIFNGSNILEIGVISWKKPPLHTPVLATV